MAESVWKIAYGSGWGSWGSWPESKNLNEWSEKRETTEKVVQTWGSMDFLRLIFTRGMSITLRTKTSSKSFIIHSLRVKPPILRWGLSRRLPGFKEGSLLQFLNSFVLFGELPIFFVDSLWGPVGGQCVPGIGHSSGRIPDNNVIEKEWVRLTSQSEALGVSRNGIPWIYGLLTKDFAFSWDFQRDNDIISKQK